MTNQKFVVIWWWRGAINAIRGPYDSWKEAEICRETLAESYKDGSFELRMVTK